MTPERIEEIKQSQENGISRGERFMSIGLDTLGLLLAALEEAQQQAAEEKKWRDVEHEVAAGYHRELIEAQQTIARQREALEWYAKAENYEIGRYTSMIGEVPTDWESRIQQEAGKKARAALGEGDNQWANGTN